MPMKPEYPAVQKLSADDFGPEDRVATQEQKFVDNARKNLIMGVKHEFDESDPVLIDLFWSSDFAIVLTRREDEIYARS